MAAEYDECYAISRKGTTETEILAYHCRFGHRNMRDICSLMGIPCPARLPICLSCIANKSKRQALTGHHGPIHDGIDIRPGCAWAWDHCGPFRLKTWGGHNILSLKVCVHSGKTAPVMTNSTGTNFEEWHAHVTQLEAHAGKPVVAQMITDNAPYFESHKMIAFNRKKGIVHVSSPSYTQELNGLAERTIGTVLAMTRTNLDYSNGPERSYGECIMAMCEVLDVLQHKAGGKLTRLEKWLGNLMPRQHERIRTWGCAAYLHLDYGPRGKIDNVSKLEPRAKLTMMVGPGGGVRQIRHGLARRGAARIPNPHSSASDLR